MTILLAALAVATGVGGGTGWIVALLARRVLPQKGMTSLYCMLLAASVLPYGLLIRHTVQFGVRTYGSYPGLDAFVHSALVMTGTLVLLSLLVARWRPLTAAFLPVALFTCHRLFVARQLHNQLPGEPLYDNGPSIAFLAVTAGATAFLVWFVRSSLMNRGARRGGAAHRPPGGLASENG